MNLPDNTFSKLYYFDNRIKRFYETKGYNSIPFDGNKVQEMIRAIQDELTPLFYKIWGGTMGAHLLDKFYSSRGNILDFYSCLDSKNRELFSSIDW